MRYFSVGVDPLSIFFLVAIACVSLASGIFSVGYLRGRGNFKSIAAHYVFFFLMITAMAVLVTAKNAVLFLVAWELMTVFAYFLITFDDEKKSALRAGYLYLIATHCGTFCLLAMFILLGNAARSMDFDQMAAFRYPPLLAGAAFALGLIGFGVKTGFFPVHIWLPHAHPAAPSHISALLSGVMIKTGIYGLFRLIFVLKDIPSWGGPAVLVIGAASGVIGVLYALGQHEIKKLLAYHSVENIGIIALGIGIGLIGNTTGHLSVALLGYAGALLHVFNHAIFKSLLFLSSGSLIASTQTGEIDQMGGLLKKLPYTGHLFLIGSLSICGFPLFNGFISEFLVYRALFDGATHLDRYGIILSVLSIASLALIGGLAAACFAKAFGVIFLGQNRNPENRIIRESSWTLRIPMIFLASICAWIGLFPKKMTLFSLSTAHTLVSAGNLSSDIGPLLKPVLALNSFLLVFLAFLFMVAVARKLAGKRYGEKYGPTWACGYGTLSPRMQVTASSFALPILNFFKIIGGLKHRVEKSEDDFPLRIHAASKIEDAPEHYIFRPALGNLRKFSKSLSRLQSGLAPQYLLYILLAAVILLLWKFPWGPS